MRKVKVLFVAISIVLACLYLSNLVRIIIEKNKYVYSVYNEKEQSQYIKEVLESSKDKIIVLDPGHGGDDPGKVGVDGSKEKDINLEIAFKLKDVLLRNGFSVLMTRTKDIGLNSELDINKKRADLRNRVKIINESKAIAVVSIHQNSFSSSNEHGAQVFYYEKNIVAGNLASEVQKSFKEYHDKNNNRKEKANDSYYILKNTKKPTLIVECGFLSNPKECIELGKEDYQDSIVEAINNGIIRWANNILESVY